MLVLKNVSKKYISSDGKEQQALKNVSCILPNKGLVFLVGESGSGKSTFLHLLSLFDLPSEGTILFGNKDTKKFSKKERLDYYQNIIGFVFQDYQLLAEYNVVENILFPLKLRKKSNYPIDNLLNYLGIEPLKSRKINELSGGEMQRVAIARTLVKNPSILICDEPTGNLDDKNGRQIMEILKHISKEKLVIVASHNKEFATTYADRILVLENGFLVQDTSPCYSVNLPILKKGNYHFPFKEKLHFAFSFLQSKRQHYFTSILLFCFLFLFVGVFLSISHFDENHIQAKAIVQNDKKNVTMTENISFPGSKTIIKNEKDNLQNLFAHSILEIYALENNTSNSYSSFVYKSEDANNLYYRGGTLFSNFEKNFIYNPNLSIYGDYPKQADEVVISSYFADLIIHCGIYLSNHTVYQPNSYEEIIQDKKEILLSVPLKIVGIKKEDLNEFEVLKNFSTTDDVATFSSSFSKLEKKFSAEVVNDLSDFYVSSNFFSSYDENYPVTSFSPQIIYVSDIVYPYATIYRYNSTIDYMTNIETTDLKENEILVSIDLLDGITNGNFSSIYESSKKDISIEAYALEYMKENHIENVTVTVDDKDMTFIIKGVTFDNRIYLSDAYFTANQSNFIFRGYQIEDNNYDNLYAFFKKYPLNIEQYHISSIYTNDISSKLSSLQGYATIGKYCSIALGFFCILFFLHFFGILISYHEKTIGILQSMGVPKKSIYSLFILAGIVLILLSFFLFLPIYYVICNYLNVLVTKDLFFSCLLIEAKIKVICFILLCAFVIILFSSFFFIKKLNKKNTIDLIFERN